MLLEKRFFPPEKLPLQENAHMAKYFLASFVQKGPLRENVHMVMFYTFLIILSDLFIFFKQFI